MHCNENPIYVFLFYELRGLSPNFHIRVSVRDLSQDRSTYFLQQNRQIDCGNIHIIAHRHMNVEIGIVASQFLFREYFFRIFGIGSLQCGRSRTRRLPAPWAWIFKDRCKVELSFCPCLLLSNCKSSQSASTTWIRTGSYGTGFTKATS